jgi:hypothetical protein
MDFSPPSLNSYMSNYNSPSLFGQSISSSTNNYYPYQSSSYGSGGGGDPLSDLTKLQQTNEALSYDVRDILDNKQRIESENFLMKKEIQRVREQNQLLQLKLNGNGRAQLSN